MGSNAEIVSALLCERDGRSKSPGEGETTAAEAFELREMERGMADRKCERGERSALSGVRRPLLTD
jgi:hypothetical protein